MQLRVTGDCNYSTLFSKIHQHRCGLWQPINVPVVSFLCYCKGTILAVVCDLCVCACVCVEGGGGCCRVVHLRAYISSRPRCSPLPAVASPLSSQPTAGRRQRCMFGDDARSPRDAHKHQPRFHPWQNTHRRLYLCSWRSLKFSFFLACQYLFKETPLFICVLRSWQSKLYC